MELNYRNLCEGISLFPGEIDNDIMVGGSVGVRPVAFLRLDA